MTSDRVESLDLIRGIAILGILAINIAGIAGPPASVLSPHLPTSGTLGDEIAFATSFVLFEGKMRALFTLLFGASLVLFIERVDARGADGLAAQLRRLGWLALFGLAHFYLLWWGDILFIFAIAGLFALLAHDAATKPLVISALAIFAIWHLAGMIMSGPVIVAEEHVRLGTASTAQANEHHTYLEAADANTADSIADVEGNFAAQAMSRIAGATFQPLARAFTSIGETLPLMLLGIVLYRSGFFSGKWPRARLLRVAWIGTASGLILTLALLGWAWPREFPVRAMEAIFMYWAALPHLLMAIGYAAILVLLAPHIIGSTPGLRIVAAGRMAFSNYIGTTLLMTALFYGWGLGLIGQFGHAGLLAFVVLGWAAILAWSKPWLSRFRYGPLEWLWRCLTYGRIFAIRR